MSMIDRERIAEISASWADRGFSCELWIDPPGQEWKDFTHETDELVTLLTGQMEFEVEGQVYQLAVGDELLIPAGALHTVRNVGNSIARWLYGYRAQVPSEISQVMHE